MMEGVCLEGRFTIEEKVGEGSMGVVYKALDKDNADFVAVKFLKPSLTSHYIEDYIRFKKEIENVRRFSHRNIIKFYSWGEHEGAVYFIMEYLDGESLQSVLNRNFSLTLDNVIDAITQLAEVLDYIHTRRVIHRDIKPNNIFILWEDEGILVKLLDFGFAHIVDYTGLLKVDEIAGTLGYMSPEATGLLNVPIDERGDLYSLGAVFYQLITGTAPYKIKDLNQAFYSHVAVTPPEPSKIKHGLPEVISVMIMKLLQKDTAERYQSARSLLKDLNRIKNGEKNFEIGISDADYKPMFHTRFIGRKRELNLLKQFYERASQNKGVFLLLGGEAGIGKSRLLEGMCPYLFEQNALVLTGRCVNQDNKKPFQVFIEVLDEFVSKVLKGEIKEWERRRETLEQEFEEVLELIFKLNPRVKQIFTKSSRELQESGLEHDNARFISTISDFIINLQDQGVLVIFLDDLQWADSASLQLLDEISGKIGESQMMILGTCRDNEIFDENPLYTLVTGRSPKNKSKHFIKINSMSYEDIESVVLGIVPNINEERKSLSSYLLQKSKGNPFFAIQVLRELLQQKYLAQSNEGWTLNWESVEKMQFTGELVDIVLKSTERLNKDEEELLCRAAVIGRQFDLHLLFQLCKYQWERIIDLVDTASYYQFIEKTKMKGIYIFTHDRIRDTFYSKITEEKRREIHCEIAVKLQSDYKNDIIPIIFDLVYHFTEAHQENLLMPLLLPAARKAKSIYAYEEALKYLDRYLYMQSLNEGASFNEEYTQVLTEKAEMEMILGHYDETLQICDVLEKRLKDPLRRGKNLLLRGSTCLRKHDRKECEKYLSDALEILGEKQTDRRRIAFLRIGKQILVNLLLEAMPDSILKAFARNDLKDLEIVKIYEIAVQLNVFNDELKIVYNVLRLFYYAKAKIFDPLHSSMAYIGLGYLSLGIPLFKFAEKILKKSISIQKKYGDIQGLGLSHFLYGYLLIFKGKYRDGINKLESSIDFYNKIRFQFEKGLVFHGLGFAYNYLGQFDKALEFRYQYLEMSVKMNDPYGQSVAFGEIAFGYIEKGEFKKAEEALNEALKISKEFDFTATYICLLLYRGYLELEQENFESSISIFEEMKRINKKGAVLEYFVFLYPMLADARIRIFKRDRENIPVAGQKGQLKEIRINVIEGLSKTRKWKNHSLLAYRSYAAFLAITGHVDKAIKYYKISIKKAKALERKSELAKGYYELAKLLESINRNEDARLYYLGACEIFKDIGAQNYINKIPYVISSKEDSIQNDGGLLPTREKLLLERRLKTLLETNKYTLSILNQNELFKRVLDSAINLLGAEYGFLFLYENDAMEKKLVIKTARHPADEKAGSHIAGLEEHASRSIIRRVEEEGKTLVFTDAIYDNSLQGSNSILATGVRSVICSPILGRNGILGMIYLENSLLGGLFKEEDAGVLELISSQAGSSIEIALLYQTLREYSHEIEQSRDKLEKWNQTLEMTVAERTRELENLNSELQAYALKVEELSVVRERARIARDVHDTLGHTLTIIINLLSVASVTMASNTEITRQKLEQTIKIAKEGLGEVRRSVEGFMEKRMDNASFVEILNKFASRYGELGMNVEISMDADLPYLNPQISDVILKVCQEGITNAVRHGNASEVSIILRSKDNNVSLFIYDNGKSQKYEIKEGVGLKGMAERAGTVNGKISYGFNGEDGFQIRLEIPLVNNR